MIDPLLGINAPVRLLREQWQTPTALAQELYAMFTAKGPREINDTLTIRVQPGQPALRIIQQDGDTVVNEGPTHNFGITRNSTSITTAMPGTKPKPRPQDEGQRQAPGVTDDGSARQRTRIGYGESPNQGGGSDYGSSSIVSPAVEFNVPTRFSAPAVFDNPVFTSVPTILDAMRRVPVPLDQYVRDAMSSDPPNWADQSSNACFGEVIDNGQGNTGDAWLVALRTDPMTPVNYDGTTQPKTVTVYVPNADSSTVAPVGDVIGPITIISNNYYYELANDTSGGNVSFGEVQDNGNGNAGSPWLVALRTEPTTPLVYDDPSNPPTYVSVYIPFLNATEVAPVGAVVGPIFKINGYYYCQPPVWLE